MDTWAVLASYCPPSPHSLLLASFPSWTVVGSIPIPCSMSNKVSKTPSLSASGLSRYGLSLPRDGGASGVIIPGEARFAFLSFGKRRLWVVSESATTLHPVYVYVWLLRFSYALATLSLVVRLDQTAATGVLPRRWRRRRHVPEQLA